MSPEKQQQQERAKAYRLRLETERDDPATSSRRRKFISDHLETLDRIPSHAGAGGACSPEPVTASVTGWRRWAAKLLGVLQ